MEFIKNYPVSRFTQLFSELENNSKRLSINSFGLSVNTLEQVFIRVGEKAENSSNEELRKKIVSNAEIIRRDDDRRTPDPFTQWYALCIRNFIYWIRHPVRTLIPLVIILICFIFLLIRNANTADLNTKGIGAIIDILNGTKHTVFHQLKNLPHSEILLSSEYKQGTENLLSPLKQCKFVTVNEFNKSTNAFDVPSPSLGLFSGEDKDDTDVYLVANRFLYDGYVLVMNLYSNLVLGKDYGTCLFVRFSS